MFKRNLTEYIKYLSTKYPAIGLTGPRQAGKTTLTKMIFPNKPYVSLENLDTRIYAQNDPRGFLKQYEEGAIFDEIQRVPELLSYLQEIIDKNLTPGRFILTGSQNFSLIDSINQSLAGRIAMVTLLPLSLQELPLEDLNSFIYFGGYPGLHKNNISNFTFYSSYISTYVERDIRQIKNIEDLNKFKTFLNLCAGRVGQLLNLSSLAQDASISQSTAKKWISILEASYIAFTLQPFFENFNKRMIKMPKIYFYDTGLLCYLLGIENASQLNNHYLKGSIFENLIALELIKNRLNKGLPPNLYFWRDKSGHEIDFLGHWNSSLYILEAKYNSTFSEQLLSSLKYFLKMVKDKTKLPIKPYLIFNASLGPSYQEIYLSSPYDLNKIFKDS